MIILGQVRLRLRLVLALPSRFRKEIRIGPLAGLEIGKTPLRIIFNNPISSIKQGSAPDPKFLEA